MALAMAIAIGFFIDSLLIGRSYAIAYSVVKHMVEEVRATTLFSTHFHRFAEEFEHHPNISHQHMTCQVEEYVLLLS